MAVAFGNSVPTITPATGSTKTSANWTISGSNLVIVVHVGIEDATAVVSSVSWSLGSGTCTLVKAIRNSPCYVSDWVIPAPTAGTGTLTVNLSASVPWQISADCFTGADQSTPCPTADAVSATGGASITNITLTPANVTANDGQCGIGGDTTGDVTSYSPNQSYLDDGTLINMESGYRIGVGSLVANFASNVAGVEAAVGVRIVAAGAAGTPPSGVVVVTPVMSLRGPDNTSLSVRGILASTPQPSGTQVMPDGRTIRLPDNTSFVLSAITGSTPRPPGALVFPPGVIRNPDNTSFVLSAITGSTPRPPGAQSQVPGAPRQPDNYTFVLSAIMGSTPQPSGMQLLMPGTVRNPDNYSFIIPGIQVGVVVITMPPGAQILTVGTTRNPDNTSFLLRGIQASTPQPPGAQFLSPDVRVVRLPDNTSFLVRGVLASTPLPPGTIVIVPGAQRGPNNTSFAIPGLQRQPALPMPPGIVLVVPGTVRLPDNTTFVIPGLHFPIVAPVVVTVVYCDPPLAGQLGTATVISVGQLGAASTSASGQLGAAASSATPLIGPACP